MAGCTDRSAHSERCSLGKSEISDSRFQPHSVLTNELAGSRLPVLLRVIENSSARLSLHMQSCLAFKLPDAHPFPSPGTMENFDSRGSGSLFLHWAQAMSAHIRACLLVQGEAVEGR